MNISEEKRQAEQFEMASASVSGGEKPQRNVRISTSSAQGPSKSLSKSSSHANEEDLQIFGTATSEKSLSSNSAVIDLNSMNGPNHIPVVEEISNHAILKSEHKIEETANDSKYNTIEKSGETEEDNFSDESEYEYEDEDDSPFSGFLMSNSGFEVQGGNTFAGTSAGPARIVDDETGTVAPSSESNGKISEEDVKINPKVAASGSSEAAKTATAEGHPRKKWREPSRAAVKMSIRAQQETSGSKRRIAQDLYRIMNQDTDEAGFSLAPQSEDSMEKWTIKLFKFDQDSNLAKDMIVTGIDNIELEMKFPEQYPFEPPFVRVVKPRFKKQTGFVINGALCMELLTKDGWNPINDIESVIVSIRSLMVTGEGRIQAASEMSKERYDALLAAAQQQKTPATKKLTHDDDDDDDEEEEPDKKKAKTENKESAPKVAKSQMGSYSEKEAELNYEYLTDYHKKKGWDSSGYWARKG